MADILVKVDDQIHPDGDVRAPFKRGHVIDVRPTGWRWGAEEGPPKFYVIELREADGLTPHWQIPTEFNQAHPERDYLYPRPSHLRELMRYEKSEFINGIVGQRVWSVQLDHVLFPAVAKASLLTTGRAFLSPGPTDLLLVEKGTRRTFSDLRAMVNR